MTLRERQELVVKTAQWMENTDREVRKAGGSGVGALLDIMPEDLLYSLVANDLYIKHVEEKNHAQDI